MRSARRTALRVRGRRHLAAQGLIALTLAQVVLDHGGFSTTAQVVFVALAALSAGAAVLAGGRVAAGAALHPLVGVLIALSVLGALSSIWTIGLAENAVEWALLPLGYALLAAAVLAAATADRDAVTATVLATICACAFASGIVGLLGAATHSEPAAFDLNGAWRPAGTLEYAPALVLLELCALGPLVRALCRSGRRAWLAAPPLGVAGAVLGLSNSRLGIAMALVVVAGMIAAPGLTVNATRGRALRAVSLIAMAALVARAALGGIGPLAAVASETWRAAIVMGVCALAPLVWALLGGAARRTAHAACAAGAAGLLAAVGIGAVAGGFATSSPPVRAAVADGPHQTRAVHRDALHGRGQIWSAGLQALGRRPLQGSGAGSFLAATADLQRPVVTSYAHDLPLELGVELGAAGALLGLAMYAFVARAWWRARAAPGIWLLAVPALAFLASNLVDWAWHIAGIGAVWAAATGALIAGRPWQIPPPRRIPWPASGLKDFHRKVNMTSVRNAVSTLLVAGACVTGLTACGGSNTVSDSSFLDRCKKSVEVNATLKAYSAGTCKCVQKKLKDQGFGDKDPNDKAIEPQAKAATIECLKQVTGA